VTAVSTHRPPGGTGAPAASRDDELTRVLRAGGLHPLFQPVVDLDTGAPVAFEALVRGPAGSPLTTPHDLFGAAAATGRLDELDVACRRAALDAAGAAGLGAPWTLFVNHQPEAVLDAAVALTPRPGGPRLVVDLPAHALTRRPAALLRLADRLRAAGAGIALDDVGVDAAVLPLLPLLRPDVVKLDLRLLDDQPAWAVAAVVAAVLAQTERDGTAVLAEGVETEEQHRLALALGASLGQGWRYGRPAALPPQLAAAAAPRRAVAVVAQRPLLGPEPAFDLLARRGRVRLADSEQLAAVTRQVELHAAHTAQPHLLVPRAAPQLTAGPPPQRDLAVLGPGAAAAVVSRPRGEGRHELVLTHDRDLVAAVLARLLDREDPEPPAAVPAAVPAGVPAARREADGPGPDAAPAPAADLADAVPADRAPVDPAPADPVALASQQGLDVIVAQAVDAERRRGSGCALLLLGTDDGRHEDGDGGGRADEASALVVRRLRTSIRSADRWIPLGDRLHAVLLTALPVTVAEGVVDRVADALLHALESSARTAPEASGVRVSIGASLAPSRAATSADAIAQAAAALAAARTAGGHCARIWPV